MPSKKYTAQQRAELKRKKAKQAKKGTSSSGKNNRMLFSIIIIIVIIAVIGIYFTLENNTTEPSNNGNGTNNNGNGGTTINHIPIANEDYYVVQKNSIQNKIDFTANDKDLDNDPLSVTILEDPSNGIFEDIDGVTYYSPDQGFTGTETVLYTIDDGKNETSTTSINIIVVDSAGNPIAIFDTTKGKFAVELYEDKVPITAKNFIDHAESGYYDGVIFHRISPDFMIQGGDPLGTGAGGHAAEYHEGYGDPDNPDSWVIPDEFDETLSNVYGTISMANSGENTGGSQFFINVYDNTYLDYDKEPLTSKHAVFGKVIEGMDIVVDISNVPRTGERPDTDVVIYSIDIENN